MENDYPTILVIVYILTFIAIEQYNNNVKLSIVVATVIYLVTYIIYKFLEALWEK